MLLTASQMMILSVATEVDRQAIYKIRHEIYAQELNQHSKNLTEITNHISIKDENISAADKLKQNLSETIDDLLKAEQVPETINAKSTIATTTNLPL